MQPRHRADVDPPIAIAGVESVARRAVILEAERPDVGHLGGGEIDDRHRIGFLQGGVGDGAVDRDVLGLEIAADRAVFAVRGRAEDPHFGGEGLRAIALEGVEIGGAHRGLRGRCEDLGEGDDADRAFRIDQEVGGGFALVRDDRGEAVGRDGHHVGQSAHDDTAEHCGGGVGGGGVEEDERAGIGLHRSLECDHTEPVAADGDGIRNTGCGDRELPVDRCRVAGIEHIDGTGLGVDHEEPIAVRLHDLGRRGVEYPGLVAAQW